MEFISTLGGVLVGLGFASGLVYALIYTIHNACKCATIDSKNTITIRIKKD